jgi:hypothetical protein
MDKFRGLKWMYYKNPPPGFFCCDARKDENSTSFNSKFYLYQTVMEIY